ncbi:MAG: NAD-dependent epimerase/dehydratase family protein [Verrucomicrobia bacterium]|nr:NAD-dependent epimerase/dehydratase family protein [Verrucomicrobiota bacterium]MDE3098672.1 NAD-dependent epimerase/dehydratase family protein [Verrucomicrobiota bacterium]
MNSKVLVTGGTGFVGRHLQQELKERGVEFFAFGKRQFDLTQWYQAQAVFQQNRDAGLILHLAGFQAAGAFPAKHTAEQFYVNNLIHNHTLEAWRRWAPQARFIGIGASCAYPSSAEAMTEEKIFDGPIHGSVYAYGATKRLLYTGILAYNDQFKLDGSYVVPAAMFGEQDDFHEATAHVPGALIGRFARAVKENLPEVEIWGDGSQVRDFMDVKDFARGLLDLAPRIERDIVNLAPGCAKTIRELALTISEAAGFKGRVFFNPDRYTGAREKFLDAAKLREKYGMEIGGDLAPGIRRAVEWFAAHFDEYKDRPKFDEG